MTIILEAKNITYSVKKLSNSFRKAERILILNNISFQIPEGSVTGIVGESGCGKTTLAKIITGILEPDSGEIQLNISNGEPKNNIQLLFQNSFEIINPNRKVNAILKEALNLYVDRSAFPEIEDLMNALAISSSLLAKYCYQLSGGERQRVALARILAINPNIIVLDEPFSAQDVVSQGNFIKVLNQLQIKLNLTVICISHNLKILQNFADQIIVLKKGEIIEKGKTEEIFENSESEYTKFLIRGENYDLDLNDFKSIC